MRTYIAPVHQAYLPPQAMDYEGSGLACGAPTSHPPVLLLAVLTVAVLLLLSAYARVAVFTSRAGSGAIGSVDVTTGGEPMAGAGGVSYVLVNPVHIVPLPHTEVSVDGYLCRVTGVPTFPINVRGFVVRPINFKP